MPGQKLTAVNDSRVSYDEETKAVRSFFGAELVSRHETGLETSKSFNETPAAEFNVENEARDFLHVNKERFQLEGITLEQFDVREGASAKSVRYRQLHHGVPVYGAELAVGFRASDGHAVSTVHTIDYAIPYSMRPEEVRLSKPDALDVIRKMLNEYKVREISTEDPVLFVYRHRVQPHSPPPPQTPPTFRDSLTKRGSGIDGKLYFAWRVKADTDEPDGNWEVLVDAIDGEIIAVFDRRRYAPPKAYIFKPDPITTSRNPKLTWADTLDDERRVVDLEALEPPDDTGMCYLRGKWVNCVDHEKPNLEPPSSTGDFMYGSKDPAFLFAMSYYWTHELVKYLQSFNIPRLNEALRQIDIDAIGREEPTSTGGVIQLDNSFFGFKDGKPVIFFGNGGVPDASDAHVIVHEYGHAIHHFLDCKPYCYDEGFCDFLAAAWLDRFNDHKFQRELVFPWDNSVNWDPERRLDIPAKFSDDEFNTYGRYKVGSIWATALWNLFTSIGGGEDQCLETRIAAADTVIRLYLVMMVLVIKSPKREDLASGLLAADQTIHGDKGKYRQQICDAFAAKGTWKDGPPPPI